MFQPQPTPYDSFASSGLPDYTYDQHGQQLVPGNILGVTNARNGGLQVGGAGGSHGGRGGGLAFGRGVGASGVGATEASLAASGPPTGSSPLLFTGPAFANSGPAAGHFHHSSFNTNPNNHLGPYLRQNHARVPAPRRQRNANMDDAEVSADLAAQEAAAREYQPRLKGPAVSGKTSSHAITEEYVKADPVYVQKTLALPQTYSHYRQILGDGNCGWRAIGFSYFEALICLGSMEVTASERNRLASYPIVGHAEYIYEDFREEFLGLMDLIYSAMDNRQQAIELLVEKFNDDEVANAVLYYIRLLASSWLKTDAEAGDYAAFIPGLIGVESYCSMNTDVPGQEIEHVGIMVLYNLFLKPTGMVLEIAYLDRSPGPEVTTYRFPGEADGQDVSTLGPMICLLFRPDHYDILYRHSTHTPDPCLDIQVNRAYVEDIPQATHVSSLQGFSAGADMTSLSMIPGFGGLLGSGPPPGSSGLVMASGSPLDSFTPSPQSSWMPSPYASSLPIRQPQHYQHQQEEEDQPIHGLPVSVLPPPLRKQTPPLRFSEYCHPQLHQMDNSDAWREPGFCTNTFKNSHFNTAHYNNPNFEPEQYQPDQEESYHEVPKHGRQKRSR